MSRIINTPENSFFLYRKIRGILKHRAMWLYLILNEAEKQAWTTASRNREISGAEGVREWSISPGLLFFILT